MRRPPRRRCEKGFTLLELIVALSLSVFVLVGVITVATSMVRYQMDAIRKGSATGGTLMAITRMTKEIEDSTYLKCPGNDPSCPALTGDEVSGCTNWSTQNQGADKRIDPTLDPDGAGPLSAATNVTSWRYCVSANSLLRYENQGTSCSVPITACGGGTPETVVWQKPGFYKMDNIGYFFKRSNDIGGVELHFIVGYATKTVLGGGAGGPVDPNPTAYFKFDTKVGMNKSYNNTSD